MLSREEIHELEKEPRKNFAILVQIAEPKIRSILHDQCQDATFINDIEDILQETYLSALTDIDTYGPEKGKFITWLARIAHRRLIDFWREKHGRPEKPNRHILVNRPLSIDPLSETLEEKSKENVYYDEKEIVKTAYFQLPEKLQEMSQLHHGYGMSQSEIARRFSVSEGGVSSSFMRMNKLLRGKYELLCKGIKRKAITNDSISQKHSQDSHFLRPPLKDPHGKDLRKSRNRSRKINNGSFSRRRTACSG